jgi:hypothetical protein
MLGKLQKSSAYNNFAALVQVEDRDAGTIILELIGKA